MSVGHSGEKSGYVLHGLTTAPKSDTIYHMLQ
jgi:hypothetical protein